jgi:serine/threonine protein kinase
MDARTQARGHLWPDAHGRLDLTQVLHRDIKPMNILVSLMDRSVKLADLGVHRAARSMQRAARAT